MSQLCISSYLTSKYHLVKTLYEGCDNTFLALLSSLHKLLVLLTEVDSQSFPDNIQQMLLGVCIYIWVCLFVWGFVGFYFIIFSFVCLFWGRLIFFMHCLSVFLSICLSIHISVYPYINLFSYLFIHEFIYFGGTISVGYICPLNHLQHCHKLQHNKQYTLQYNTTLRFLKSKIRRHYFLSFPGFAFVVVFEGAAYREPVPYLLVHSAALSGKNKLIRKGLSRMCRRRVCPIVQITVRTHSQQGVYGIYNQDFFFFKVYLFQYTVNQVTNYLDARDGFEYYKESVRIQPTNVRFFKAVINSMDENVVRKTKRAWCLKCC